jgi:hypothetical protein
LRLRQHALCQPEVKHLGVSPACHEDVGRLDVAMDDAGLVRGIERVGNLGPERQDVSTAIRLPLISCFSVLPCSSSIAMNGWHNPSAAQVDMDLQLQPKFLKVLEEKTFRRVGHVRDHQVDTRVIAATHQDLMRLATEKKFRADLLYRINTVVLRVPPLRERLEDVEELVDEILHNIAMDLGRPVLCVNSDGLDVLRSYSWPGNIRELRNVLERAALLADGDTLTARHFFFDHQPQTNPGSYNSHVTLQELETQHIEHVVAEENGHVDRAAIRLGFPAALYTRSSRLFALDR